MRRRVALTRAAKTRDALLPGIGRPDNNAPRSSSVTLHLDKFHPITAISRVAKDLDGDDDWLRDAANQLEIEN